MLFSFSLQEVPSTGCSVTNEQIEQNYTKNQQASVDFYTAKYTYKLDFSGWLPNKIQICVIYLDLWS